MKNTLFLFALFCMFDANAQNYYITFTGTGASTSVGSVKVENLTAGTLLIVSSGYRLSLTFPTGINPVENKLSSELNIYPNPTTGNSLFRIYPPVSGNATISVFDMKGKQVAQIQNYLENYLQEFRLSGLNNGLYLISVKGNTYQYSGKLLSNANAAGTISIEKTGNNLSAVEKTDKSDSKGGQNVIESQPTVDMAYTSGDRLKFTGISGIYSTIITDIPASDKTINFNFIACTDGDNNNYPVVTIGTQTWMAENLKTTRYKDGITVIPPVTDITEWTLLTTPGYCWYNNDETTYKAMYGALYNWYTVNTGNLCPTGWHVPTDAEWTTLTTYLGGESVAGGKLKETGTTHWLSPNTGATNESGFTALPGGYRFSGAFGYIGDYGFWWSSTVTLTGHAWNRDMGYFYSGAPRGNYFMREGFSVRCLRDNM